MVHIKIVAVLVVMWSIYQACRSAGGNVVHIKLVAVLVVMWFISSLSHSWWSCDSYHACCTTGVNVVHITPVSLLLGLWFRYHGCHRAVGNVSYIHAVLVLCL